MIPQALQEKLSENLSRLYGENVRIHEARALSGGCIHHTSLLRTSVGEVCLKYNTDSEAGRMFRAEARDLQLLNGQSALNVPGVIDQASFSGGEYLVMEYLAPGQKADTFWEHFGHGLAELHQRSNERFGLDYPNNIGALPQDNTPDGRWGQFYIERRILPMVNRLIQAGRGEEQLLDMVEAMRASIDDRFPPTAPALLHGDLWSGNVITGPDGHAAIIDPAAYYGHPEMEIAFTRMFGGFHRRFYEAYAEVNPPEPGFDDRRDLYDLYPLLVHAVLFGGGYVQEAKNILQRYGAG